MTDTRIEIAADKRRELKVKIKSLACEARIIRSEEARVRDSARRSDGRDDAKSRLDTIRTSLHEHRVNDVRRECRYSLLAYEIIRRGTVTRQEPAMTKASFMRLDQHKLAGLLQRFGAAPHDGEAALLTIATVLAALP